MNWKTVAAPLLIAAVGETATVAKAAEIDVKILNKGAAGMMVFEPALIKIAPSDTVKFLAADKGHNAELIPGAGHSPQFSDERAVLQTVRSFLS